MRRPDDKVLELPALLLKAEQWRSQGRRVVTTNGCFDLLHVGHLRTLLWARTCGDLLVVLLNSDRSVRALKGETRPLVEQAERAELLAGLECVDAVYIFDEDTPIQALQQLRPQVHVKGGDYQAEQLPETPVVRGFGGEVRVTPLIPGRSSSLLEARLRGL